MIEVIVTNKQPLTASVCQLQLTAADGSPLPAWQAGAHIDVHLPNGIIRQYSLCGATDSNSYEIAILNEPNGRGGSQYIHNQLQQGDTLTISAPKNLFPLVPGKHKTLLIAAGIGITPILAMAEQLHAEQLPFELHFCARDQQHAAYYERITQSGYARHCLFHFSLGDSQKRLDPNQLLAGYSQDTQLYLCGPNQFIHDVIGAAEQLGWPAENIHREFFAAEAIDHSDDQSFEVVINSTGQVLQVAKDISILNVLEDNGLFIPVACEEGVCGTCITGLLEGEADHKDVFMSADEKQKMDQITPCCSRAKSKRLVLDL
ncbi:MAG: oxidoreductase [Alteromonadaceae bacterium]|nr:oxidoreductase [Alteromonadaceae bacterium]